MTDFPNEFEKNFILYGTVIYKITTDKNGNITKEIIDLENLSGQAFEQLEIIESYKRKNE